MQGIDFTFKFGESLIDEQWRIEAFISSMHKLHPEWVSGLGIVRGPRDVIELREFSPSQATSTILSTALERGPTFYALEARFGASPTPRRTGSIELKGGNGSITAVLGLDDHVFTRLGKIFIWGNTISLQLRGAMAQRSGDFNLLSSEFWTLCKEIRPVYANAHAVDEFNEKSMDLTHGARAIGNDISKHFRGLYWENFFRSDLVRKIWGEMPPLPDCAKTRDADGLAFCLGESPYSWADPSRVECESKVRAMLGNNLFFHRENSEVDGAPQLADLVFSHCALDEKDIKAGATSKASLP
jgi:hypothetical protein